MYVNGMPFMNGIKAINHSTEPLLNSHIDKLYQVLDVIIHIYNHVGHTIT